MNVVDVALFAGISLAFAVVAGLAVVGAFTIWDECRDWWTSR